MWVESNGGFWAATSFDMVLRMTQDWETFSSAEGVALQRPGPDEPGAASLSTSPAPIPLRSRCCG